jgi:hypothetical protein
MELFAGRDDHLVRRLDLTITMSLPDIDDDVRRALRGLAGAVIELKLDLTNVNKPVRVAAPE